MEEPKSILESRTFWFNLLGPVFVWLSTRYGLELDPSTQTVVILGVMTVTNIGLRRLTNEPVTFSLNLSLSTKPKRRRRNES
jgi:hypothetical protein